MKKSRCLALTLSLVGFLALATSAGALVITDLDTGLTVPNLAWNILNDASVATYGANNDNYYVKVGTNSWGANEWNLQNQQWHAAGVMLPGNINGYQVDFTYDLNTWDSYNQPNPQKGYWDNFGVELDNTSFLWNRVPAVNDPMAAGAGHWLLGGTTWGDGICETYSGNSSVTIAGAGVGNTTYLSTYLSTAVMPERDNLYPSWGRFNWDGTADPGFAPGQGGTPYGDDGTIKPPLVPPIIGGINWVFKLPFPQNQWTITQYHTFASDPNDNLPPDYIYQGFTPSVPDQWTWDAGMLGAWNQPLPAPPCPWMCPQGQLWCDLIGVHVEQAGVLTKLMGNVEVSDKIKKFYVAVLWYDSSLDHDVTLTLGVDSESAWWYETGQIDDGYWHITYMSGEFIPQPDWEMFFFEFDKGSAWIDNIWVGTTCIPEPGTIALIGFSLVSFAGIVRKKLKV